MPRFQWSTLAERWTTEGGWRLLLRPRAMAAILVVVGAPLLGLLAITVDGPAVLSRTLDVGSVVVRPLGPLDAVADALTGKAAPAKRPAAVAVLDGQALTAEDVEEIASADPELAARIRFAPTVTRAEATEMLGEAPKAAQLTSKPFLDGAKGGPKAKPTDRPTGSGTTTTATPGSTVPGPSTTTPGEPTTVPTQPVPPETTIPIPDPPTTAPPVTDPPTTEPPPPPVTVPPPPPVTEPPTTVVTDPPPDPPTPLEQLLDIIVGILS